MDSILKSENNLEGAPMNRKLAREYQLQLMKDQIAVHSLNYLEKQINYLTGRSDAYEDDHFLLEKEK